MHCKFLLLFLFLVGCLYLFSKLELSILFIIKPFNKKLSTLIWGCRFCQIENHSSVKVQWISIFNTFDLNALAFSIHISTPMTVGYIFVNGILSYWIFIFKNVQRRIFADEQLRHSPYNIIIQWLHEKNIYMNISDEFLFSTSIKRIRTRVWSCVDNNNNNTNNSTEWEKGTRLTFHNDNTGYWRTAASGLQLTTMKYDIRNNIWIQHLLLSWRQLNTFYPVSKSW